MTEIRRAMDLLAAFDNVDKTRIGFVGHDYSGMYGAITAGVEPRAKTYVFVAVTSSLYNWAFFSKQPKSKTEYVRRNAVFELTDFVSRIRGSVFCQFANNDPFISRTDGNVFFNAVTSSVYSAIEPNMANTMRGNHRKNADGRLCSTQTRRSHRPNRTAMKSNPPVINRWSPVRPTDERNLVGGRRACRRRRSWIAPSWLREARERR